MSDKKIKQLEKKIAENLAGWQKALADYQNLQKETEGKFKNLKNFITSDIIQELLPIFDNYQTAIDHIPEDSRKESWAVGLEHILNMWQKFLDNNDIKRIKTIGETFDPYIHEAMGQVEDKTKADQEIISEQQTGFTINGQIIRPAKVIINQLS